jgi:5'-nucleotidase
MVQRILISNDDGIDAPGLAALYDGVKELGEVTVIAPLRERSAIGHAISFKDLKLEKRNRDGEFWGYALDGTPADCVKLGITTLLEEKPDLVISGINRGANTGNSILYSGTVAAAMEGTMFGVASIAVSLAARRHGSESVNFSTAAKFTVKREREFLHGGKIHGAAGKVRDRKGFAARSLVERKHTIRAGGGDSRYRYIATGAGDVC